MFIVSRDCHWTLGGEVGTTHVLARFSIFSHITSSLYSGCAKNWSIGFGISGLWLFFAKILESIWKSYGSSRFACGFLQSHSHLFQPVPLKLHAGLLNLVSSLPLKQLSKEIVSFWSPMNTFDDVWFPFCPLPAFAPQSKEFSYVGRYFLVGQLLRFLLMPISSELISIKSVSVLSATPPFWRRTRTSVGWQGLQVLGGVPNW